jgi:hypothetical protein
MPTLDLMTMLPISEATFIPAWRQEVSRQAGGRPRAADLGPEVWMAKIACSLMTRSESLQAEALIDALDGAIGTFYAWNPRAPYPQADPNGTILGSYAPVIAALGGDNKSLQLAGVPAGYRITIGDFVSFDHGTSPVHRCLHQCVAAAVADGSGVTPMIEVRPHIRAGAVAGLGVTLKRPSAEMYIVPGSYDSHTTRAPLSAMSFTAVQVP